MTLVWIFLGFPWFLFFIVVEVSSAQGQSWMRQAWSWGRPTLSGASQSWFLRRTGRTAHRVERSNRTAGDEQRHARMARGAWSCALGGSCAFAWWETNQQVPGFAGLVRCFFSTDWGAIPSTWGRGLLCSGFAAKSKTMDGMAMAPQKISRVDAMGLMISKDGTGIHTFYMFLHLGGMSQSLGQRQH